MQKKNPLANGNDCQNKKNVVKKTEIRKSSGKKIIEHTIPVKTTNKLTRKSVNTVEKNARSKAILMPIINHVTKTTKKVIDKTIHQERNSKP